VLASRGRRKARRGIGTYAVSETEAEFEAGRDVVTIEVSVVDVDTFGEVGLREEVVDAFGLSWSKDVVVLCITSISINPVNRSRVCLTDSFLATVYGSFPEKLTSP